MHFPCKFFILPLIFCPGDSWDGTDVSGQIFVLKMNFEVRQKASEEKAGTEGKVFENKHNILPATSARQVSHSFRPHPAQVFLLLVFWH